MYPSLFPAEPGKKAMLHVLQAFPQMQNFPAIYFLSAFYSTSYI